MANVILVIGDTGTGKSTSLKNLNPENTVIINVLGKELPWRGSRKDYNADRKNIRKVTKGVDIIGSINAKMNDPKISNIVIDDIGFSMLEEYFEKASIKGYEKFNEMASNFQKIIKYAKDVVPADKNIIMMFHSEVADKENIFKVKLIGKMIEDKYNPLSIVSICIFTNVSFDKDKNPQYNFIVKRSINDEGIVIPAKSPEGMFTNTAIPNDLAYVIDCMQAYYNGDEVPVLETEEVTAN